NEYENAVGGDITQVISNVLKENNTPENIEKVKTTYQKTYLNNPNELTTLYGGIHQLLQTLQENNINLAINSNRKTESIKYYTSKFLNDITFKDIRGNNPDILPKPDPTNLLIILKKSNIKKEEALYVGDTKVDVETSQNAGVDCVIVKWGQGNEKDMNKNHIMGVIDKPEDLYSFIE
ncbi:MAG: HAD family hydrolase, partial [Methanosphaera sp.]